MSQRADRKALLGRKLGMSQVWDENGFFVPVTLVDVSTNVVTAIKTEETDGYTAVQIGYGQIDPTKVTKPLAGHFAKAGVTPRRHLVEVREDNATEYELGQELTAEVFEEGAVAALTPITENKFTTVVLTRDNVNEWLSVRNIPTVHPIFVDQLNTYDVVTAQYVVFSKEAFEAFVAAKTEPKEA